MDKCESCGKPDLGICDGNGCPLGGHSHCNCSHVQVFPELSPPADHRVTFTWGLTRKCLVECVCGWFLNLDGSPDPKFVAAYVEKHFELYGGVQ